MGLDAFGPPEAESATDLRNFLLETSIMSDDVSLWPALLGFPPEQVHDFQRLATDLETTPVEILALMMHRVIRFDRDLHSHGLPGIRHWLTPKEVSPASPQDTDSVDLDPWEATFCIELGLVEQFARLSAELDLTPAYVLRTLAQEAVQDRFKLVGDLLADLRRRMKTKELVAAMVDYAMAALPLRIRASTFMWPADHPFPWSATDCKAAVLGYELQWPGGFDDFSTLLRGRWEMSDGFGFLHQS